MIWTRFEGNRYEILLHDSGWTNEYKSEAECDDWW